MYDYDYMSVSDKIFDILRQIAEIFPSFLEAILYILLVLATVEIWLPIKILEFIF